MKNLEKLFERLEMFLWHDRNYCSSSCAANNHKKHSWAQPVYPALTEPLFPNQEVHKNLEMRYYICPTAPPLPPINDIGLEKRDTKSFDM